MSPRGMSGLGTFGETGAVDDRIDVRLAAMGTSRADVEERFVRGSGPGGQKINKTSSSVSLRHIPTGVEVRCQRERSQSANRQLAWLDLCAKLEEAKQREVDRVRSAREKALRRTRPKSYG